MNRLRTCLLTVCAVAAFTSQAFAQVTVTAADVTSDFAVGNIKSNQYDSTVTSLNIGSPGSSSWDFSGLHRSSGVTLTSVAVQGTPFASHFPAATFALQTNVLYQGIPAVAYIYFQLGANLLDLGLGRGHSAVSRTVRAGHPGARPPARRNSGTVRVGTGRAVGPHARTARGLRPHWSSAQRHGRRDQHDR